MVHAGNDFEYLRAGNKICVFKGKALLTAYNNRHVATPAVAEHRSVYGRMAVQTPKQRLANEKFAKRNEKFRKYGQKKNKAEGQSKFAISKPWLILLAFLLVGGGIIELLSYLL